MSNVSFADLGLAEPLLRALDAAGYTVPTPIQARTIPALLQGRDVLGIAQTGTGKTAAFALPVLQHLSAFRERPQPKHPRALVLAPTRELAVQIGRSFDTYGRGLGLKLGMVIGGLGFGRQIETLNRGVDILVATPGRLLDLVERGNVKLAHVTFLVLDEADRMFDMGFIRDVRRIVASVSKQRQTLLFSATMPGDISKLASEILKNPEKVEIAPQGRTVEKVDQRVYFVPAASQARAAQPPAERRDARARHRLHPHQARRQSRRRGAGGSRRALRGDPRQQVAERPPEGARQLQPRPRPRAGRHRSRLARHRRHAASPTSSTTSCRPTPRATSIASAAPRVPAPRASPCRSATAASAASSRASSG